MAKKLIVRLLILFSLIFGPQFAIAASQPDTFSTEGKAAQHCPADTVVWLNLPSGIYHVKGQRYYANTKAGAYTQEKDWGALPSSKHRREVAKGIETTIATSVVQFGGSARWNGLRRLLTSNGTFTVGVAIGRCSIEKGICQWKVFSDRRRSLDLLVVVRMDASNERPTDFICLPRPVISSFLNCEIRDDPHLSAYRCATIEHVIARVRAHG